MTKKLLAVVLGLSAWIGGTVAATIGNGTAAQASPLFVLQQAHADYTPSLDGNTPLFILLLGSDSRPGVTPMNRGRSDSIHILGINPAAHRATVFGIPRDSYVPLSTGGTDKINAAMPIGGPEAEVQTVENVTGIKFAYYVLTGFQQVTQAVNQIGGLEVNVPYSVVGYQQTFPSGLHRMTGQEVLGYSRTRHSLPLGDFDRSLNQGVVLTSALTQFRNEYAKDPTRLYDWLGAGLRTVETTVPLDELIKLAGLAQSIPASRVTNLVALGTSAMQGTQSIVNLSPENQALWQDMNQDGYILSKDIPRKPRPRRSRSSDQSFVSTYAHVADVEHALDQQQRRGQPAADPKRQVHHRPASSATSAATSASWLSSHGVNSSPTVTGNDDWNTIAPVMLPIASVSFRRRTQSTLLNFSGSSVASGATSSENASGGIPAAVPDVADRADEDLAPPTMQPERERDLHERRRGRTVLRPRRQARRSSREPAHT